MCLEYVHRALQIIYICGNIEISLGSTYVSHLENICVPLQSLLPHIYERARGTCGHTKRGRLWLDVRTYIHTFSILEKLLLLLCLEMKLSRVHVNREFGLEFRKTNQPSLVTTFDALSRYQGCPILLVS